MQISKSQKVKLLHNNSKKRQWEWFWGLPSAERERLVLEHIEFAKKRAEKLKNADSTAVAGKGQEGDNTGGWEEAEEDEEDKEGDEEMEE